MTTPQGILESVKRFTETGEYPGGIEKLQSDIVAIVGTPEGDKVMALLESFGAREGGDPPLDIEQLYVPGTTPFTLSWPLGVPLPVPFEALDHKTQFYVLFGEWSRREMEGSYRLSNGDPPGAKEVYAECLERATQLGVTELVARSHEGLARVSWSLNDRAGERFHLEEAMKARA